MEGGGGEEEGDSDAYRLKCKGLHDPSVPVYPTYPTLSATVDVTLRAWILGLHYYSLMFARSVCWI